MLSGEVTDIVRLLIPPMHVLTYEWPRHSFSALNLTSDYRFSYETIIIQKEPNHFFFISKDSFFVYNLIYRNGTHLKKPPAFSTNACFLYRDEKVFMAVDKAIFQYDLFQGQWSIVGLTNSMRSESLGLFVGHEIMLFGPKYESLAESCDPEKKSMTQFDFGIKTERLSIIIPTDDPNFDFLLIGQNKMQARLVSLKNELNLVVPINGIPNKIAGVKTLGLGSTPGTIYFLYFEKISPTSVIMCYNFLRNEVKFSVPLELQTLQQFAMEPGFHSVINAHITTSISRLSNSRPFSLDSISGKALVIGSIRSPILITIDRKTSKVDRYALPLNMKRLNKQQAVRISPERLLLLGGGDKLTTSNAVLIYDLEKLQEKILPSMRESRRNFGVTIVGHYVVVAGGKNGSTALSSCEKLNMIDPVEWEEMPSLCQPRVGLVLAHYRNKLYAIGDIDKDKNLIRTIEAFDEDNRRWRHIGLILPSGLGSLALFGKDDRLFFLGSSYPRKAESQVFEFPKVVKDGCKFKPRGPSLALGPKQPAILTGEDVFFVFGFGEGVEIDVIGSAGIQEKVEGQIVSASSIRKTIEARKKFKAEMGSELKNLKLLKNALFID